MPQDPMDPMDPKQPNEPAEAKEFEIAREFEVDATPGQVWEAITTGTAGWLWPMEFEPREGGAAAFGGTVVRWDPPHRFVTRVETPEAVHGQTLNQIDETIEARSDGRRAWVRYVHSGILTENWENQYDGADRHTDFYLHTLCQYLTRFTGRTATFATTDGPAASAAPDAFAVVERALGVPEDAVAGTKVRVRAAGGETLDAVVDYRTGQFLGLRTENAMYRFFGRNHWGAPVGVSVHDFSTGADGARQGRAWEEWLAGVFA